MKFVFFIEKIDHTKKYLTKIIENFFVSLLIHKHEKKENFKAVIILSNAYLVTLPTSGNFDQSARSFPIY